MSKRARRILFTSLVLLVAAAIVAIVFTSQPRRGRGPAAQTPPATPALPAPPESPATAEPPPDEQAVTSDQPQAQEPPTEPAKPISGVQAMAAGNDLGPRDQPPQSLGSLDPRRDIVHVEFSRSGASIARVAFTGIWQTAAAKRQAERYQAQLQPEEPFHPPADLESQRYVLQDLARAHGVMVNGTLVNLQTADAWSETAPGTFESRIVDESGEPLLHITRQFSLGENYNITLKQRVRNVSNQTLDVQWSQLGPTDLSADSGYIDRRRFDFGYLPDPQRQPDLVLTGEFESDRSAVLKLHDKALEATDEQQRSLHRTLWPNSTSGARGYHLAWFASMNRYFSVGIHPTAEDVARGVRSLEGIVSEIRFDVFAITAQDKGIYTTIRSPMISLSPGAEQSINLGLYAGPLDRDVLAQPPYGLLAMREMILYSMGGCCTFLTFQWLAKLLLNFLSFLHDFVVFDWGVAIMLLVVVVRILLHPLTKKSQINMMRFGKQMSAMKPELDKIQKKYASDRQRLQQEQMKLMREHGVNPLNMLGCLPMFLQMPIWIALWAMLYFAFDIRHQSAFYGLFQAFGNWQFLGDLSSPDYFWLLPGDGFSVLGVRIDALNLLPLLLGVVFFIQQKYMSPPPSPNMTPEQMQQQKIMKVMMVVMMPIFLYKAPSGLTLYIFTSTLIGIMESKYIRSHIDQLDLGKPGAETGGGAGGGGGGGPTGPRDKPKKPKDSLGRLWAEKLEAARAKRKAEPSRSFKKRK